MSPLVELCGRTVGYLDGEAQPCANPAEAPHTCPYAEDVGNDHETLCTCCLECAGECAADI